MKESKLVMENKSVVVPGDTVAEGMEFLPGNGTYRNEGVVLANRVGVLNIEGKVLKVLPLAGTYLPKENDVVIGKVIDILMSGWRVDINCPYVAVLPLQEASFDFIKKGADLTEYFELNDYVVCKIVRVTSQNLVDISMKSPGLKKLKGGHYVHLNPAKVPRVIGRKGSMVGMLKHVTGCEIIVGQNGLVWLSGEPEQEAIALQAIALIDKQAHIPGLTDRTKRFLEEKTGKEIDLAKIRFEETERDSRPRHEARPPRRNGTSQRGTKRFRRPREESFRRG